jgi:hypothetical protein
MADKVAVLVLPAAGLPPCRMQKKQTETLQ